MECSTDEDMVTMLTIMAAGGLLGFLFRRRFLLSGVLVGLVVPTVALFSQSTVRRNVGYRPRDTVQVIGAGLKPRMS